MDEVSSKSWYVKHRPRTLREYGGNKIKKTVETRFCTEDKPHVIMIEGTRGCGKTTFCRLISKYYLCENPNEDGSPCEECAACQELNDVLIGGDTGVEVNGVTEVDATIANGKDAIQNIVEEALIAPMYTKYKIIIFDEFHMVSVAAQNSLLKILEDIPSHLVVLFATTNPEKVLQTIKSRCQLKLKAQKQNLQDMVDRLEEISRLENLTISREALEMIAKKGDRVPRECINLLEDVAKTYNKVVTLDNVKDIVDSVSVEKYIRFFECANEGLEDILMYVAELHGDDFKWSDYMDGLMTFVLDSMWIRHSINMEDYTPDFISKVNRLFKLYDTQEFDMLLQVLEKASHDISDDNLRRSEVAITIAGMRVSKIKLLAEGLGNEQQEALTENKISMVEHHKMIQQKNEKISEQLKMQVNPGNVKDTFKDVAVISENIELFNGINTEDMKAMHSSEKEFKEPSLNSNSSIDDFFNN